MSPRTERLVAMQSRNFKKDMPPMPTSTIAPLEGGLLNPDLLPPLSTLEAFKDHDEDADMRSHSRSRSREDRSNHRIIRRRRDSSGSRRSSPRSRSRRHSRDREYRDEYEGYQAGRNYSRGGRRE